MKRWPVIIALLLLYWATRTAALQVLPLHNDEGLHLTRAVEVWNGHPFHDISDGKIINHWLIAAFYPQHAPDFAGRIATVLVGMVGLAAGWALARRLLGWQAGLLAAVVWITCPYLFFYERTAFSDSEAGVFALLAALFALRLAESGRWRDVLLTGLALAAAALFKFTAVPYALTVTLIVLMMSRAALRLRLLHLVGVGLVVAACFSIPLLYLLLKGRDFFTIALEWIGGSSGEGLALISNVQNLWAQLTGFGTLVWTVALLAGFVLIVILRGQPGGRRTSLVALAGILPTLIMMTLGREVLSRHYVVALPMLLTLAGCGLALLVGWFAETRQGWTFAGLVTATLIAGFVPFMLQAYRDPALLTVPDEVRRQHFSDHSSGYGLREAARDFPDTTSPDIPIIASMFPGGCRLANFYAQPAYQMICADNVGRAEIEAALAGGGAVYVLTDHTPLIGVDVTEFGATATHVADYPRPGETNTNASVVLWLLERPNDEE